MLTKYTT